MKHLSYHWPQVRVSRDQYPFLWCQYVESCLWNVLKPEVLSLGPRWRIQWYVGVYQSRDETESLCRPDLYSSTRFIIPYINGSKSSSLYTCNTSWHSVHYMILNKPLVKLTTAHYQSAVSMISFAQVLTVQWSNTIPCWNVWFHISWYSISTLPLNRM